MFSALKFNIWVLTRPSNKYKNFHFYYWIENDRGCNIASVTSTSILFAVAGWNHPYDDAEHVVEKLKQGASNNDMMTSEVRKVCHMNLTLQRATSPKKDQGPFSEVLWKGQLNAILTLCSINKLTWLQACQWSVNSGVQPWLKVFSLLSC